ncbi:efflux RND transporter periplasmic adaptor subunit [uncultured Lacinutrix sp.]|uniref:efflux RND transporter periplasmic adaptor subunit n=1 Tax=uncultured Lacinutrix sp. TaxID=574032 RepID=UPI00261754BF|nr:efflux RND transporter periplasmic adaptor subunit [uncultured Lacinutrix sp.]
MKNIFTLLILTLVITSCGDKSTAKFDITKTTDIKAIKAERDKLVAQQQEINAKLETIDSKIDELTPEKKLPLITTFITKAEKFEHFLELQGNVATDQNLVITPEMGGILRQVFVKEGQRVSKGQLLARIDDGGLSQQVTQLQIQADLAKTTYERQKRLWDQKIGSEIQYLQSKSAYESQVEAVKQLQSQLNKTAVRAPFTGVIDDVITEQGSVVAPSQTALMRIVNLKDMYISVDVPERYISNVTKNKNVEVNFPVLGETLNSKVRQTGNFINPANRTFNVEIAVPNKKGNIKPNLTAKLKINDYTNEKALLVPQNIISENAAGEQYIYILTDRKDSIAIAKKIIIETGKTQGDVIEVLKGIENNAEIIQEGARSVKDGQKVQIINSKS